MSSGSNSDGFDSGRRILGVKTPAPKEGTRLSSRGKRGKASPLKQVAMARGRGGRVVRGTIVAQRKGNDAAPARRRWSIFGQQSQASQAKEEGEPLVSQQL